MELAAVASRVAAIPELIEDGVNGRLVPPDDAAALGGGARRADRRSGGAAAARPRGAGPRARADFAHGGRRRPAGRAAAGDARRGRPDRGMSRRGRVLRAAQAARPSDRRPATAAWRARCSRRWRMPGARSSWRAGCAATIATAMLSASAGIAALGARCAARLLRRYARRAPAAWLTYHAYHKSPDWLGPAVAGPPRHPLPDRRGLVRAEAGGGALGRGSCGERAGDPAGRRGAGDDRARCPCLAPLVAPPAELRPLPPFLDAAPFQAAQPRARVIARRWPAVSVSIPDSRGCSRSR